MKRQRDAEHAHRPLGVYHVAVIQQMVTRKRERDRAERRPSVRQQARERQIEQRRRAAEHRQRQRPRRQNLRRQIALERHHRELDQRVAAEREAAVNLIARFAVRAQIRPSENQKSAARRKVVRHGERLGGLRRVSLRAVEVIPVQPHRQPREHDRQQNGERRPLRERRPAARPKIGESHAPARRRLLAFVLVPMRHLNERRVRNRRVRVVINVQAPRTAVSEIVAADASRKPGHVR